MKRYWVYILTNDSGKSLYVGVTSNLDRRLREHEQSEGSTFCRQYNLRHLAYTEEFSNPRDAIQREKQIKSWSRKKKEQLIASAIRPYE